MTQSGHLPVGIVVALGSVLRHVASHLEYIAGTG